MPRDAVDRMLAQWADARPDLDVSPMAVVGRVSRLTRLIERALGDHFAEHGIESWIYDVLATLRRSGEPYELSPGELVERTMVTTGAMTNRIDRLVDRGLVEREHDPVDRRRVIVRLTPEGLAVVDRVAVGHYELEAELLSSLSERQRSALTSALRTLLVDLGDVTPDA